MKPELTRISVIIPTLNEEKYLKKTLLSVKNQSYKGKIETIVVDSCSKDHTVKIAKQYASKLIIRKTTIAEAKNLGASVANGKILIFLDADTTLSKNWIELSVNDFANNCDMVVGVFGPQEKNLKARLVANFWGNVLPTIMRKIGEDVYIGPATFAIKKNIFNLVGGFDEKLQAGEDVVFVARNRRRLKIVFDKKLKTFTSMRRFERGGYLKWMIIWLIVGLPLIFGKRAPFDSRYFK